MKLTKEIKIALVAIVGILILYFGINFLMTSRDWVPLRLFMRMVIR